MIIVKQISSLEKVRANSHFDYNEVNEKTLLKGERFSYQIAIGTSELVHGIIEVESELKDFVKIYTVNNAVMDLPVTRAEAMYEPDYITQEPGLKQLRQYPNTPKTSKIVVFHRCRS